MEDLIKMTGESEENYNARKLWRSFCDFVLYENRYFIKHELLDLLKNYVDKNTIELNEGELFYRARIIDDNAIKDHMVYRCYSSQDDENSQNLYHSKSNSFRGLTKEASFVPPKEVIVGNGRANPKYIRYLYMSKDPTTALFEVRPLLFDAVNLAKIEIKENLKIANIASDIDYRNISDGTIELYTMGLIQGAFSKPTNNKDVYIVTQIIAEYIKSIGYDGIKYNSSLHKGGINYTIFNYQKCESISSQDFRIEDFKITARAAFGSANYQDDLSGIIDNKPYYLNFDFLKNNITNR